MNKEVEKLKERVDGLEYDLKDLRIGLGFPTSRHISIEEKIKALSKVEVNMVKEHVEVKPIKKKKGNK